MRTLGPPPSPHTYHFPWGKGKLKTHEIHQMVVFCAEVSSRKAGVSSVSGDLLHRLPLDSSFQGSLCKQAEGGTLRVWLGCTWRLLALNIQSASYLNENRLLVKWGKYIVWWGVERLGHYTREQRREFASLVGQNALSSPAKIGTG